MGKISGATDWLSTEIQHSFLSVIRTVGLIVAAAPPAIIFSFAAYGALEGVIGNLGAKWAAVTLGVSLEAAGVSISHSALRFFGLWRQGDGEAKRPFVAAGVFTAVYLLAGILAILIFDKNPTIRLTGVLAYAVAFIMYMASGLDILADERETGVVAQLKKQVKRLVATLKERETVLDETERERSNLERRVNDWTSRAQEARQELKDIATRVQELETAVNRYETELQEVKADRDRLRAREIEMQEREALLKSFNPLVLDIARLSIDDELTQAIIAERHSVSEAKVSRLKASINGHK